MSQYFDSDNYEKPVKNLTTWFHNVLNPNVTPYIYLKTSTSKVNLYDSLLAKSISE